MVDRLPMVTLVLAILALIAVIADGVLVLGNQELETKVQARQQFLNQTIQVNQVTNALVQALGAAAVNANDQAVRDLLAEFGITINATPTGDQKEGRPQP